MLVLQKQKNLTNLPFDMKKVLILTYYFPPLGLGGTQRIAKFVKYLPLFGWQPTIVTVKPITYWALDPSLEKDVREVRIFRTESYDPQRLLARLGKTKLHMSSTEKKGGWLATVNQKLVPFFLVPDSKILWHPFAFKKIIKLLADEHFDALMTTSPPHSVHLLGCTAAKKFGLPWLADFRDGWAGSHIVYEPTRWHFRWNARWQKRVVRSASAVVAASPGIDASLRARSETLDKFHVITNGFDPDDFPTSINTKTKAKYTLCYSGTINRFADPEPFLDALVLLKSRTNFGEKLTVEFVGLDTIGGFADLVKSRQLDDIVTVVGQKDHVEAVKHLASADALLLIARARDEDTFIPGKTFEYLGAQKPIFCISTSRFTNEVLKNYALSTVIESFDPEIIYSTLLEFLNTNWDLINKDSGFVEQFNRQLQTQKLAEILNTIT